MGQGSPAHKLIGNFSATLGFSATFSLLSNFQCIRQRLKFCVSIVRSVEYKNIANVENIFVQSFNFAIR